MILQKRSILLVLWISIIACITLLCLSCPAGPPAFHTVSFDSNGGSAVDDITNIAFGAMIVAPSDPTFAGRSFSGWFRDQVFNTAWNFAVDRVVANLTLYAKWTVNTYTVSFNSNEGSVVDDITEVPHNAAIGEPLDPTKAGFTFDAWYRDIDLTALWDFDSDTVTENLTLYAKWTAETYTVSFDSDDGSAVADITDIVSGATIEEPVDPTKAGFNFDAWYRDIDLMILWDFDSDTVTENLMLYAKWTAAPTYTVSFDSNDGSAVADITDIVSGATIEEPVDPTKAGFNFDAWYRDIDLMILWDFDSDTVTENLMLYAKWTATTTYTVTFNCNGGSAVADLTEVLPNAKITEPDEPTWDYRLFWGWYTDPSLSSWFKWDFAVDEVTDDTTLYAKWTFGGTGPAGGLVFYENANYVADGWRYLEAAPKSKELGSLPWASLGNSGIEVGSIATAIGTGQANTDAIVSAMGLGSYAARYCAELVFGTYDDWFLPSIDETKAMRDNLYAKYLGGFTNDYYWSSTEYCQYTVLVLRFDYPSPMSMHPASAQGNIYVRPIRAFQEIE